MKIDDVTLTITVLCLVASVTSIGCLLHKCYKIIKDIEESIERYHARISRLENHLDINTIKSTSSDSYIYKYVSPYKNNK